VRGEGADGAGHRRRARARLLHWQAGAVHRQLGLQEAKGGHVPILRAQAVRRRVMQCIDSADLIERAEVNLRAIFFLLIIISAIMTCMYYAL
jgi:hypothetical protein